MRLKEKSCLVVEPDLQLSRILGRELRTLGFGEVFVESKTEEAIARLHTSRIDVVVCHHDLELVRYIRHSELSPCPEVPLIMVTSNVSQKEVMEERDLGVDEIIAKPASLQQIFRRIRAVLVARRSFVHSRRFHGPDRRRHLDRYYHGPERRYVRASR